MTSSSTLWTKDGLARVAAGHPKSQGEITCIDATVMGGLLITPLPSRQSAATDLKAVYSVYKFDGARFEMGFEVENDPDRISFPKLFLDPSQLRTGQQLASFASVSKDHSEETLLRGVSMYLAALKKRAVDHMKDVLGEGRFAFMLRTIWHGFLLLLLADRMERSCHDKDHGFCPQRPCHVV